MNYPGLGTDILLSDAGQLLVGANGDLVLCEDRDCLLQGVIHRLITPLGGLFYDPDYGLDLLRFLHVDNTRTSRYELGRDITRQLQMEPRVLRTSIEVQILSWTEKVIEVCIRFAWIDGTTPENLVLLTGSTGPRAVIDVSGYALTDQWVTGEAPAGGIDGENAVFTLGGTPAAGTLNLFLDGVLQQPDSDYALSGRTITLAVPPETGTALRASYLKAV